MDELLGLITETDGDCEKLGTDRNTFCMATEHLGIPDKYLGLIWEALTAVPQRTKLRETLRTTLTEAPTEEEFLRAIKDIKKLTTPGMSNVSYGNLKNRLEERQTHCYQLLKRMWLQEHIPQQWKEK